MSKKKREYIIIGVILSVLLIGYFALPLFTNKDHEQNQIVEVRYKDEEIMSFDIDEDNEFVIEVDQGLMHIEVKDGQYRVHDVDCPDKICEKVGWVKKNSPTLIVCLPNNIVIVQV